MEQIRYKVETKFNSSYGLAISAGVIPLEPDKAVQDLLLTVNQALYKAKVQKNLVAAQADLPC